MTIINIPKRVQIIRHKFTNSLGLPFQELLPESIIQEALKVEKITYRKRLMVCKQFSEEKEVWRSRVYLDRYTGEVLQLRNSRSLSLGDEVVDSFNWWHFGTFGGLPTRIVYFFVGHTPLILFITGLVMWWYQPKNPLSQKWRKLK